MTTSCIERILEEIAKRNNFDCDLPYKKELEIVLKLLNPNEKVLVGKYFRTLEWNIGSTNVLSILQKCNIITAANYVLLQNEDEHIQLVLNDLLETKFELFANIVTNCYYNLINSAKLTTLLEECFRRLFRDLFENPNSLTTNYIIELKQQVQDEVIVSMKLMHINVLLMEDKSTLKNAISHLHIWRQTIIKDTFLFTIITEITSTETGVLEHILKKSMESDFKGWKFYVILLEIVANGCGEANRATFKKHLKDLFKQFIQQKDENYFYILLLTARTVCTVDNSNLEPYNNWFKTTIGDMNYVINANEFKFVMATLSGTLAAETECSFLDIQVNTAIAAPPLCNQLVLNYKKHCRQRISLIKGEIEEPSQRFDPNESILIDD